MTACILLPGQLQFGNPSVHSRWYDAIERGVYPVNTYTPGPGARVLWCLRRKRSDVRCVLFAAAAPIEVHVLHDADLLLKESFFEESLALGWAREYGDRLRGQGWRDKPADCSPSSAA